MRCFNRCGCNRVLNTRFEPNQSNCPVSLNANANFDLTPTLFSCIKGDKNRCAAPVDQKKNGMLLFGSGQHVHDKQSPFQRLRVPAFIITRNSKNSVLQV